ncbi:hypothetical protein [Streptomyces violaceorubidus]|nr:hypothetical protein [Streptomyces violaceorubidus]
MEEVVLRLKELLFPSIAHVAVPGGLSARQEMAAVGEMRGVLEDA